MSLTSKEKVDELRILRKQLWQERVDDRQRAEGVATKNYSALFVDAGTIIHATRDFKGPDFKEILKRHKISNADKYVPLNPQVGGWTKFIKVNISNHKNGKSACVSFCIENAKCKKRSKSGRGWLHL